MSVRTNKIKEKQIFRAGKKAGRLFRPSPVSARWRRGPRTPWIKGENDEPCTRLPAGQNPLRAIKLRTMHFGKLNLGSSGVQPCTGGKSNHASYGVQPCKFRSPTMQVFDALGAFGLGLRGFLPSLTAPPSKSGIRVEFYFFPAFFSATRSGPMTMRKISSFLPVVSQRPIFHCRFSHRFPLLSGSTSLLA